MELTIIGYGKMGQEIEKAALDRGHKIYAKIDDSKNLEALPANKSVAIDFSQPDAFSANYKTLAQKFPAVIVGTTGWDDIRAEVTNCFNNNKTTLIYASNFSLGVNVFFKLIDSAAKLLASFNYDPYILEMHHTHKKDAPSGTAKTLEQIIAAKANKNIKAVSIRSGQIKGIHEVGFESEADKIILKHEAYSRSGFAHGAILAAEWSATVSGVWDFKNLLEKQWETL